MTLAVTIETLARFALLWVCLSIVVAALFGAIQSHGKRRFKRARQTLIRHQGKANL